MPKACSTSRDRVEVAAAFSPTPARREAFAEAYGFPVSGDLDAILADRSIDAVMILTPPNTHLELVRQAASAGKHILLEKPLEISIERAESVGRCRGGGRCHARRRVAAPLQAGEPCAERHACRRQARRRSCRRRRALQNWRPQSYYDQPGRGTKARDGGGVLLTQAIHTLDLMISLAGLPVEVTAYAATSAVHRMETEDLAMGAMRFDNGAIGTVSATTSAFPGHADAIDIIGTKGMARLEGTSLTVQFHDGTEERISDTSAAGGAGADPMAFPHEHHCAVLADFLDAVETGSTPRVSGREALKVHRFIEAILRSAATGRPQPV